MTARRDFLRLTSGAWPCLSCPSWRVVAGHPDVELIAACEAFDALEREYGASFGAEEDTPALAVADALRNSIHEAQEPLVEVICAARPATLTGHAARARSLVGWAPDLAECDAGGFDQRLTGAILRDLTG